MILFSFLKPHEKKTSIKILEKPRLAFSKKKKKKYGKKNLNYKIGRNFIYYV